MSTWEEIETHLAKVNTTDYNYARGPGPADPRASDKKARESVRRAFLDLERKADERDTLRAMLLEQGIENARLSVEIEQVRTERDMRCGAGREDENCGGTTRE